MKKTLTYHWLFLCAAILGLCLTTGCEQQEEGADVTPGTNAQLKTPQDLSTKVMGTTVTFAWRAQPEATSFLFQLSSDASFGNPQTIALTASTHSIEALAIMTNYWVRVQAAGAVEAFNSPYTEAVTFRTGNENILKATPAELLDISMTLQWTPGAAVTHFIVTPDGGSDLPQRPIADSEKETGEATLTGLSPETLYRVKLYNGDNLRGEGEYTTLPLILTDLAVTIVNAAPDSVNIAWNAGEEQLTHFIVAPDPVEGSATVTVNAAAGTAAITGLLPETEYTLTAFFNGSTRGATTVTTAALATGITLTATNITQTTAVISWTGGDRYITQLAFTPAITPIAVTEADAAGKTISGLLADTDYSVDLQWTYGGLTYTRSATTFHTIPAAAAATVHVAAGGDLKAALDGAGNDDVIILDGPDYVLDNYTLRANVAVTIMGAAAANRSKVANSGTGVVFTLADGASLRLENIELAGGRTGTSGTSTGSGGADYFINHATAPTSFNDIHFENCYIHHFGRSIVRINADNISVRSVTFNNCLFEALGDNGNYAIVHATSGTGRSIANVTVTNSTFANVWGNVFYNQGAAAETFAIANCTFYDVWNHQNQGLLRTTATAVPAASTVTGIIIGAIKKNDATVRLFDAGTASIMPTVSSNNYKTGTDCSLHASYSIGFTEYNGTSTDLFTDPANGDFHFKDAAFAGANTAGDPRWRGGGGGGGDTPGAVNANGYFVITDGYEFICSKENIAAEAWVAYTAGNVSSRDKCTAAADIPNLSGNSRVVEFKVKGCASFTISGDGNNAERFLQYAINDGAFTQTAAWPNGCTEQTFSTGDTGEITIKVAGVSGSVYLGKMKFLQ